MIYYEYKESTHSKVDAPRVLELNCSKRAEPFLWDRQEGYFYLRLLFLLSRKFSNARRKLQAVKGNTRIPSIIIMIS